MAMKSRNYLSRLNNERAKFYIFTATDAFVFSTSGSRFLRDDATQSFSLGEDSFIQIYSLASISFFSSILCLFRRCLGPILISSNIRGNRARQMPPSRMYAQPNPIALVILSITDTNTAANEQRIRFVLKMSVRAFQRRSSTHTSCYG